MVEKSYLVIYGSVSFFLLVGAYRNKCVVDKLFFGFFFLYYFIPFAPISDYRGIISLSTLKWFSVFVILSVSPFFFPKVTIGKRERNRRKYTGIRVNSYFTGFVLLHLFVVYIVLAKVYFSYGIIVIDQEARFGIGGVNSYLIKSAIYIPLFFPFLNQKGWFQRVVFLVAPLLPALLIGSRGTVILIIIALVLLVLIRESGKDYNLKDSLTWQKRRGMIVFVGVGSLAILNVFYYLRRVFSDVLISNVDLVSRYFTSTNILIFLIMPLYFGFKETVGITNTIIEGQMSNTGFIPLFFLELFTILPGEQQSPGRYVADLIGAKLDGGLTPGLFGGLFLDFGYISVLGGLGFVIIIRWLVTSSKYSDAFKIVLVLTISQFFHLYHRGFLKWEYFLGYLVVGFYLILLKRYRYQI